MVDSYATGASAPLVPPPPPFALPPLAALSYAPLLFLLCVLLQPSVPSRVSQPLRILLFFPVAYLATTAPATYPIQPAQWGVGANFRWAIFAPYFLWKAVEWCFLVADPRERERELTWIAFDGKDEAKLHSEGAQHVTQPGVVSSTAKHESDLRQRLNGVVAPVPIYPPSADLSLVASSSSSATTPQQLPTPAPSPPFRNIQPPSVAEAATPSARLTPVTQAKSAALRSDQRAHPLRTLADATHLLTSLRGIGYAWGPPARSLPTPPPSHDIFFRRSAWEFVQAHTISTVALALQVLHRDGILAPFLSSHLPFLSPSLAESTSALLSRLLIGVSLHAQMLIGFSGANMLFCCLACVTNALLDRLPERWGWTWRAVFDLREYPSLFDRPFSSLGEGGVSVFWGKRWHALFRASFNALGFRPSTRLARRLGLPSTAGKLLGAFVVFFMSAWMHAQALYTARLSLDPTPQALAFASALSLPLSSLYPAPWSSLSFTERYGTWIFFLAQPIAVALESVWTAVTKKRIGGWAGKIWTGLWIVVLGQAVVGKSWLALGLAHGLPPVDLWTWHRWLLPTFALAPLPAFTRIPT
ncbi:hypothetical protein JCM11251_005337 [Rhodosporidiobolus azoricus]